MLAPMKIESLTNVAEEEIPGNGKLLTRYLLELLDHFPVERPALGCRSKQNVHQLLGVQGVDKATCSLERYLPTCRLAIDGLWTGSLSSVRVASAL
jgi:hypothetical protein